jgi:hypothetical protein
VQKAQKRSSLLPSFPTALDDKRTPAQPLLVIPHNNPSFLFNLGRKLDYAILSFFWTADISSLVAIHCEVMYYCSELQQLDCFIFICPSCDPGLVEELLPCLLRLSHYEEAVVANAL